MYTQYPGMQSQPSDSGYVMYLEQRIAALESRLPLTGLLSPKFTTRAFAVFGHYLAASLMIMVPIWVLMFIIGLIAGVGSLGILSTIMDNAGSGVGY